MVTKKYNIKLNASTEAVWNALWGADTYPQWTSAFAPGSNVKTQNWEKGTKVHFVDGEGSGMVSMVEDNVPNSYMSFRHIGELKKDGSEDLESAKEQGWANSHENYRLTPDADGTRLDIDLEMDQQHEEYMDEKWPLALEKLKQIVER